jgi:hypothetical protein
MNKDFPLKACHPVGHCKGNKLFAMSYELKCSIIQEIRFQTTIITLIVDDRLKGRMIALARAGSELLVSICKA